MNLPSSFSTPAARRSGKVLAALFLGPLTGPLVLGAVSCARQGRWPMATVYAAGVVEVMIALPALAHWALGVFAKAAA